VANKIQLGPHLTQGLGAGANPEIGKQSCEESIEDIAKILKVNTRMAFITAGMGGGTGTGGAPVVSKICRDLGILTVGIVTTPFTYEGRKRMKQAQEGIDRMRDHVDTILIISNDKLRQQFGNLPFTQAFAKADDILATAAKCITDVITSTGQINVDFADVCTVMKNGGVAILGSASMNGENRALCAVEAALNSPLLNDSDIRGAKWLLLNITSSAGEFEHTMDEAEAIQAYVQHQAGDNCDVILGMGHDPNLKDKISVTVIATGFHHKAISTEMPSRKDNDKIVVTLGEKTNVADVYVPDTTPVIKQPLSMAPQMYETPPMTFNIYDPRPFETPAPEPIEHFSFTFDETPAPTPAPEPEPEPTPYFFLDEKPQEESPFKLVIKNEEPAREPVREPVRETMREPVKPLYREAVMRGERQLTEEEIEEKRRFEEQKKALEDRAERLRRMSFNIKGTESSDEMEAVPAYMRKNLKLDNQVASSDSYYSGYTIGSNDPKNHSQAGIQTVNTFLDGKKPD
jgi:cell division protein FtsZ